MQKFKFILVLLIIGSLLLILFSIFNCEVKEKVSINYEEDIKKYLQLLNTDPKNCLYIEHIASSYQGMNEFTKAITFYNKAIDNCSNKSINKFQLGICYYLIMRYDEGIQYMDQAIEEAKKSNDIKMMNTFIKEKRSWLKKRDLIKSMDWNKNKITK